MFQSKTDLHQKETLTILPISMEVYGLLYVVSLKWTHRNTACLHG